MLSNSNEPDHLPEEPLPHIHEEVHHGLDSLNEGFSMSSKKRKKKKKKKKRKLKRKGTKTSQVESSNDAMVAQTLIPPTRMTDNEDLPP